MEYLVGLMFWFGDLFDIRSSDPLTRAFKRARRGVYVSCIAAVFCFGISRLIDTNASEQVASNIGFVTGEIRHVLAGVVLFIGISFTILGLSHCWTLYRVETKPELFY